MRGKTGIFPDSGIRILPFDHIGRDEVGRFPGGRGLRREEAHPMRVFGWPERYQVAEKREFRHTVLGTHHFGVI